MIVLFSRVEGLSGGKIPLYSGDFMLWTVSLSCETMLLCSQRWREGVNWCNQQNDWNNDIVFVKVSTSFLLHYAADKCII